MRKWTVLLLVSLALTACSKDDDPAPPTPDATFYFPPLQGTAWDTTAPSELGWDESAITPLRDYLAEKNTRAFLILVNGRIVMEEYFNGHTPTSDWEWNSAGKTLVSAATGLAMQENLVDFDTPASAYLGEGWTNMPLDKENLITPGHLLTMTSGIDDTKQLVVQQNLTYVADAGNRWAYGNVFQKLMDVVAESSGQDFEAYFNEKLKARIGMDGYWNYGAVFTIYYSTARSMARFGLLALNQGKWEEEQILNEAYFSQATSTSQNLNPSYGYLWWLNGKPTYMLPSVQTVYPGPLVPNAPADMYAAMGALDQRLYVIPSRKMVVVRMGGPSDPANPVFAVSGFDNDLWERIRAVID
jgi:CubicO group peptidase (beta-lactamase class C family)